MLSLIEMLARSICDSCISLSYIKKCSECKKSLCVYCYNNDKKVCDRCEKLSKED